MSDTNPSTENRSTNGGQIVIPADVYAQLEVIRRSGVTNMSDRKAVQFFADRRGYFSTVCWLEENRETYYRGLMKGFTPDRLLTDEEQVAIDEEGAIS